MSVASKWSVNTFFIPRALGIDWVTCDLMDSPLLLCMRKDKTLGLFPLGRGGFAISVTFSVLVGIASEMKVSANTKDTEAGSRRHISRVYVTSRLTWFSDISGFL